MQPAPTLGERLWRKEAIVLLPDRHRPRAGCVPYALTHCPYCNDAIYVRAGAYETQLPRRIQEHLAGCGCWSWTLPTPPRSRQRDGRKAFGQPETPLTQLSLGNDGRLERHPLGSLLRCVATGRRAAEQRTQPPALLLAI